MGDMKNGTRLLFRDIVLALIDMHTICVLDFIQCKNLILDLFIEEALNRFFKLPSIGGCPHSNI